jgi:hypothetical protein
MKNGMDRACSTHGREEKSVFVRKPEGKRPLGRARRRWQDNTETDLTKIGLDWLQLVQDIGQWRALVNRVMNFRVP